MLHPLLTFFALQYFFQNYWISSISSLAVFIYVNSSYKKSCGCDVDKKPQIDK